MKLSIHDFPSHVTGKFGFGLDPQLTAAALRKVADAIEAKEVIPQGAEVHGVSLVDNFTLTTLRLTFAEKICETTTA